MSGQANIAALLYLVAGVLFILALKGLSSPASSRAGNRNGMIGMLIAVLTTLWVAGVSDPLTWALVIGGLAIGGTIGAVMARRIAMTAMPQLVAAFHSLVGLAAVLTAAAALYSPQGLLGWWAKPRWACARTTLPLPRWASPKSSSRC